MADDPPRDGSRGPSPPVGPSPPSRPQRVFLTGASSGIGAATARLLVDHGYEVWGTSRRMDRLAPMRNLHPVALDLSDPDALETALGAALDQAGGFDVLVNNAGNGIYGPLECLSAEQVHEQFQVLVFAPLAIIRRLLPAMRARGRGLIINVTSLAAEFPIPYMGAYSAAKAALGTLSWNLQMELCQEPVEVVELQPGDIHTGFNDVMARTPRDGEAGYAENLARAFAVYDHNMRVAPPPERVAAAILRLIESTGRNPPVVAAGKTFQARVAPALKRYVPTSILRWGLRRYYRLRALDTSIRD